jgi:iron complex outermembrane receptor protein
MKKHLIFSALISLMGLSINTLSGQQTNSGANSPTDTAIDVETIEAAMVNAVSLGNPRGNMSSVMIIQKKDPINQQNLGRDIPFLTQSLTNVITTSDAGNGIGYSGIRVRGSDATRTNITINGVPINDAESQGTFWVNMPDLSSSINTLSLTKGAGLSTHGAGAFGATLAIGTEGNSQEPYYQIDQSLGSYGTLKTTLKGASKPIKLSNKETLYINARLSEIMSNGFVDRATSNLAGYQTSIAYEKKSQKPRPQPTTQSGTEQLSESDKKPKKYNSNTTQIKFLAFGGRETTYQSWWGVPIEKYNMGENADSTNHAALQNHYLRNSGFMGATYRNSIDSANLFNSNHNKYNYKMWIYRH